MAILATSDSVYEIVAGIVGLGLIDSLNPFSIAAMALVLTGTRHLALGVTFIATTFLIYSLAGIGLLAGWAAVLLQLLPLIPAWVKQVGLGLLGLGCVVGAVWLWVNRHKGGATKIADLVRTSVLGTAIYAAYSTISDLPTAVPYFGAVHILAQADLTWKISGALLVVYNVCYVLPLFLLLWLRLSKRPNIDVAFAQIKSWVDWSFTRLMPPLIGLLGLYCLWEVGQHWIPL